MTMSGWSHGAMPLFLFAMSFRSKLVGTWRLLSVKVVNAEGKEVGQPYGEGVQGAIMYSPDGYMSSWVSGEDVQPWRAWNDPSRDEGHLAARLMNGYTGKYYLDEVPGNKQTVFHDIRVALPPNFGGATQKRNVEIKEAEPFMLMTIKVDTKVEVLGHKGYLVLDWRKEQLNEATKPTAMVEEIGQR